MSIDEPSLTKDDKALLSFYFANKSIHIYAWRGRASLEKHHPKACSAAWFFNDWPIGVRSNIFGGYDLGCDVVSERNCEALSTYSHLLVICTSALNYEDDIVSNNNDGLPFWLLFIRGACVLLQDVFVKLNSGPLKPLIKIWAEPLDIPLSPNDPLLEALLSIPYSALEGTKWSDKEYATYHDATFGIGKGFHMCFLRSKDVIPLEYITPLGHANIRELYEDAGKGSPWSFASFGAFLRYPEPNEFLMVF